MWMWGVFFNDMKKFKDLNRSEQIKAIDFALKEAIVMVYNGQIELENFVSENEMKEFLLPEAKKIAELAYYPDLNDVVIKL